MTPSFVAPVLQMLAKIAPCRLESVHRVRTVM